jgi:glycosyltransferase involved in cell wall biosynthesis
VGDRLKFLFLEPFFGGSHREFAEGLISNSRHGIDLVTLPARYWKWRMRGAALYFIKQISSLDSYDGLITTDLMSLSDFKALAGGKCPPTLVYFHENQFTYPLSPGERMDYQFGFTDITTAMAAEHIVFNSRTHRDAYFEALPKFINMMPEFRPKWVVDEIRAKADILYPGCRFGDEISGEENFDRSLPPLIIWNHRWEFDKDPDAFFVALDAVLKAGIDFRLALLGETSQAVPKAFISARERYGQRIVHYGYVESREQYLRWLRQGTIVVSTALQENFGIAVVEAIRCGCIPLLPMRLSYPEIIPSEYHDRVIYQDHDDMIAKLTRFLSEPTDYVDLCRDLARAMTQFAWPKLIDRYDQLLQDLAGYSES